MGSGESVPLLNNARDDEYYLQLLSKEAAKQTRRGLQQRWNLRLSSNSSLAELRESFRSDPALPALAVNSTSRSNNAGIGDCAGDDLAAETDVSMDASGGTPTTPTMATAGSSSETAAQAAAEEEARSTAARGRANAGSGVADPTAAATAKEAFAANQRESVEVEEEAENDREAPKTSQRALGSAAADAEDAMELSSSTARAGNEHFENEAAGASAGLGLGVEYMVPLNDATARTEDAPPLPLFGAPPGAPPGEECAPTPPLTPLQLNARSKLLLQDEADLLRRVGLWVEDDLDGDDVRRTASQAKQEATSSLMSFSSIASSATSTAPAGRKALEQTGDNDDYRADDSSDSQDDDGGNSDAGVGLGKATPQHEGTDDDDSSSARRNGDGCSSISCDKDGSPASPLLHVPTGGKLDTRGVATPGSATGDDSEEPIGQQPEPDQYQYIPLCFPADCEGEGERCSSMRQRLRPRPTTAKEKEKEGESSAQLSLPSSPPPRQKQSSSMTTSLFPADVLVTPPRLNWVRQRRRRSQSLVEGHEAAATPSNDESTTDFSASAAEATTPKASNKAKQAKQVPATPHLTLPRIPSTPDLLSRIPSKPNLVALNANLRTHLANTATPVRNLLTHQRRRASDLLLQSRHNISQRLVLQLEVRQQKRQEWLEKRRRKREEWLAARQRKRAARIEAKQLRMKQRQARIEQRQLQLEARRRARSAKTWWLIPADHPYKVIWDLLTILLSFLGAYLTHQNIRDRSYEFNRYIVFTEVWFFMDILLNFVTEHKASDGSVIRDGRAVWARYLTTWFAVDVLSLIPWERIYVRPIVEMQKRRGFFKKTFFRSKAVVRVTRVLRGRHLKLFGKVASQTKHVGVGGRRLLRLILKYVPKYLVFYRNMRGVLMVRTLRQIHWVRKVFKRGARTVEEEEEEEIVFMYDDDDVISDEEEDSDDDLDEDLEDDDDDDDLLLLGDEGSLLDVSEEEYLDDDDEGLLFGSDDDDVLGSHGSVIHDDEGESDDDYGHYYRYGNRGERWMGNDCVEEEEDSSNDSSFMQRRLCSDSCLDLYRVSPAGSVVSVDNGSKNSRCDGSSDDDEMGDGEDGFVDSTDPAASLSFSVDSCAQRLNLNRRRSGEDLLDSIERNDDDVPFVPLLRPRPSIVKANE